MSILSVSSMYYINDINVKKGKLREFTEYVVQQFCKVGKKTDANVSVNSVNSKHLPRDNSIHASNFLQVKPLDFLKLNVRIGTVYLYILLFNFSYGETARCTNYTFVKSILN